MRTSILSTIFEAVSVKVEGAHEKVLSIFLDRLEDTLDALDIAASKCSYNAALSGYVENKILMHHIQNYLDDHEYECGRSGALERMGHARMRMSIYHGRMYDNVCGVCNACKSRRRRWPTAAMRQALGKSVET